MEARERVRCGVYIRCHLLRLLILPKGGHMGKTSLVRWMLAVMFTITTLVGMSGFAAAQYYDDDRYSDRGSPQLAHQHGYQSGYHDGYRKGLHEGRENDPGDINVEALQDATHRYESWMGPIWYFRDGYRDGYRNGFRSGYQASRHGWWHRDDDDGWRWH